MSIVSNRPARGARRNNARRFVEMIDYARLRTDLLALAVFAATVFLALCLASFHPADTADLCIILEPA